MTTVARTIKRITLTEWDARRYFRSTDTSGRTYTNRLDTIDLLDDGSVWCWAANIARKTGEPFKNGSGLTMGPVRDYGQDVADVVAEAVAAQKLADHAEALEMNTPATVLLTAMGVPRDELRYDHNVWNAGRKIAVAKLRKWDEIEAHKLNAKVAAVASVGLPMTDGEVAEALAGVHGAPGHVGDPGNCAGCHAEEFGEPVPVVSAVAFIPALDLFSAGHTTTPIAAVGTHPVTDRTEVLYFASNRALATYFRTAVGIYDVFDLNRATGEWGKRVPVEHAPMCTGWDGPRADHKCSR